LGTLRQKFVSELIAELPASAWETPLSDKCFFQMPDNPARRRVVKNPIRPSSVSASLYWPDDEKFARGKITPFRPKHLTFRAALCYISKIE
jgi:hypothetical protein